MAKVMDADGSEELELIIYYVRILGHNHSYSYHLKNILTSISRPPKSYPIIATSSMSRISLFTSSPDLLSFNLERFFFFTFKKLSLLRYFYIFNFNFFLLGTWCYKSTWLDCEVPWHLIKYYSGSSLQGVFDEIEIAVWVKEIALYCRGSSSDQLKT